MVRAITRGLLAAAMLVVTASPALADSQCPTVVGQGWPPAVGNYGQAASTLLGGQAEDALSLLVLPARGKESQVLVRQEDGRWTVSAGVVDERIYNWNNSGSRVGLHLQLEQTPEFAQAPLPEALAKRLVGVWAQALSLPEVAESAPLTEGEVLSFTVNGQRFSGQRAACGQLEALLDQAAMLVELAHSKDKKYEKRYRDIERALDKMHDRFYGEDAG
jgi:hypothetical protein